MERWIGAPPPDSMRTVIRLYALVLTALCVSAFMSSSNGGARYFAALFGTLFLLTAAFPRGLAGFTGRVLMAISVIGFLSANGLNVTPEAIAFAVFVCAIAAPFAFPAQIARLFDL